MHKLPYVAQQGHRFKSRRTPINSNPRCDGKLLGIEVLGNREVSGGTQGTLDRDTTETPTLRWKYFTSTSLSESYEIRQWEPIYLPL